MHERRVRRLQDCQSKTTGLVVLMEYIGLFFKLPVVMNQRGGKPNKSLKRLIEEG